MAPVFNRADNDLRRPLGCPVKHPSTEVGYVEQNRPARDLGAENQDIPQGNDYEYDEAHDVLAGPLRGTPAPHRVDAPKMTLDAGGDYGYDEAHDFGRS
jgi:hypothetical protein